MSAQPRSKAKPKTQRPRLHKVILVNDDFTPREFVVIVLRGEFRMSETRRISDDHGAQARGLRRRGGTKATRAMDFSRSRGYPLQFITEPEE